MGNKMQRFLKERLNYNHEQISTFVNSKISILGGNFLIPLLFVFIYKDIIPQKILFIWFALQTVLFIIRYRYAKKIKRLLPTIDRIKANIFLKKYLYFIFLNALLWGSMSVFVVIYSDLKNDYLYFIFIMGMTTAAMSTLNSIFHALVIYITTIMIPFSISHLLFGDVLQQYLLALFGALYFIFIIMIGFNTFRISDLLYKQKDELEIKNQNFKSLLNITMEAIVVSNKDFKIVDINDAGLKLFKAKYRSDAIDRSILEFVPQTSLPIMQKAMQNEIQKPYEIELVKINGEKFPALVSSRNLLIDGEKMRVGTILDLTKLKEKDKQLLQQSRLAQMGEMIGMIAHQWRQPLTAISSSANTLALDIMMDNYNKEFFEEQINNIAEYSQHLSSTIDDFRNFFKQKKDKQIFIIEEIVDNTLSIIKGSLDNKAITLTKEFNSYKKINSYPNELKQVVLNLIKNAEDILLEKEVKNPWIKIKTFIEDDKVILTVADNAGGVPEDIKDKIFDPYFSTKLEKDGTGLGLYMSKTIIDEHCKGKLSVSNNEFGAVFRIELGAI